MIIEKARPEHAPLIAKAVMMAVGEEICNDFAAPDHTLADVEKLFTTLAAMPDSQYSFNNTLVAIDSATGEVMGLCVAYDGGRLHTLRRRFFEQVREQLSRDMEGMADETDAGEFYLDTVATFPGHRGKGIATALINATIARADEANLPSSSRKTTPVPHHSTTHSASATATTAHLPVSSCRTSSTPAPEPSLTYCLPLHFKF